jgi:hypothetical protein
MELKKVYSGSSFNEINKGKKFYKITNEKENHLGFQYRDGLNIDIHEFNPTGECKKGGLYFTDFDNLVYYFGFGIWIREVILPDDAQIYVENKKYKADKFILKEKMGINQLLEWNDPDFCKSAVQQNGYAIVYVKSELLTEDICKLAVQQDGYVIEYVKSELLTEDICKLAVQQNWCAIVYVKPELLTEDICKLAVQQNWLALKYVKSEYITYEICKLAVLQNGFALQYIRSELQTKEMCDMAVKQNKYALEYVKPEFR